MYSNIYQDSSKTVVVCYDIYGTRDPKIVVSSSLGQLEMRVC
jgi:hypothetical protein